MPRVDQRRWAEVYLRGLLLVEGKKSVRRISEDILSMPVHQSLQQFINQSPWEWGPVRADLARFVEAAQPPRALVMSRTSIPKRGDRSVGVERHFLPEAGRVVNSQIGLTVDLAVESANIPVNWRLLLSDRWLSDPELRGSAHIPEGVQANPPWREFLDMLEEMDTHWATRRAPVTADLRQFPAADHLVVELARRQMDFVVEVDGSIPLPEGAPLRHVRTAHSTPGALRRAEAALEYLGVRQPRESSDPARRHIRVASSVLELSSGHRQASACRVRLLQECTPGGAPTRFWITSLMEDRVDVVLALSRLAKRSRGALQVMEERFGLRDFEGRSHRGWHHHMTMVSAAYVFDQLGRPEGLASAGMSTEAW